MASGRAIRRRTVLLLVVAVAAALIITGAVPNPFPTIWAWVSEERPLADDLAWQERLGARPAAATAAGDALAVAAGSSAQLYQRGSGRPVSMAQTDGWEAQWVVVAGSGAGSIVISSPRGEDGYEVRDPDTGRVIHTDDEAVAVWGFGDAWLDLRCDDRRACQLRGYQPDGVEPQWRTDLPGQREGLVGGNPELAGPQSVGSNRIPDDIAGPEPVPPLLGFPVTRRGDDVVVVVDTRTGQIRQELAQGADERVIVVGGRVIRSVMRRYDGVCVSEVTGYDAVTGDPVWGPSPYHLWSTGDVGCEQREPPVAGGAAVAVRSAEGEPMILDAYDGRVLWSGELGEQVEALSAELAVIRDEDGFQRRGIRLGGDGALLWERRADEEAALAIAQCGVVVSDRHPNRVYVWDKQTGEDRLSVSTSARVLACAPDGVLLTEGRSIGFARFDGLTSPESGSDSTPPEVDSK
ncbi:PQQ-binding-like beta-propeller repeat protein [Natronosporangium hydrolyticum]|uniref:PQQ-binding-like beta-propeller repeat protein n=1 Tax=Natronosporangium hydrolyticum TaxID=2811111 RepID=A0A895YFS8_9ACTN|nr:PQQ-binding-like beta-propeller repeat protein [Natronosporangium hydrolyticum]QSB14945.1 PQQ-binding-like beta-propeller repeat protein [Natronosporangium hydrolyticum]